MGNQTLDPPMKMEPFDVRGFLVWTIFLLEGPRTSGCMLIGGRVTQIDFSIGGRSLQDN